MGLSYSGTVQSLISPAQLLPNIPPRSWFHVVCVIRPITPFLSKCSTLLTIKVRLTNNPIKIICCSFHEFIMKTISASFWFTIRIPEQFRINFKKNHVYLFIHLLISKYLSSLNCLFSFWTCGSDSYIDL